MPQAIVVDGSVLCGVDQGKTFDYERLRAAIRDIRESCGNTPVTLKVFVDASLRWKLSANDKRNLEDDVRAGVVEQTPAGVQADPFILNWAQSHGAIVITNDLYRDYVQDFPWISEVGSGRFVTGVFDTQLKKWTFLERYSKGNPQNLSALVGSTLIVSIPSQESSFVDPTAGKYKQPITRHAPTAVVFLLDQSGSMDDTWSQGLKKSTVVASFVNDTLYELVLTCTRPDGVRPYIDVAIIGYGGSSGTTVRSELPSTSLDDPFLSVEALVPLAQLSEPSQADSGQPIWIEPKANGATPMDFALIRAEEAVKKWVASHPDSFPPIVFNITDGESTDGDPSDSAFQLTKHATSDGNVLLFTAHISSQNEDSIFYPEYLDDDVDPVARTMFNMTSHVPQSMRSMAAGMGISMGPASRGFLFNAGANDVIGMLNVGSPATRVSDPQR